MRVATPGPAAREVLQQLAVSLRFLCPVCTEYVTIEEGLQSAACPACESWLHAIECTSCQHTFVALGHGFQECPRCATRVHFSDARLRTFGDARDRETGHVSVAERWRPVARPRSAQLVDPHAVPRFLAGFFLLICGLVIAIGVLATLLVDLHLSRAHDSGGVIWFASIRILGSTAVTASVFAFFSYALTLLLEILERPGSSPVADLAAAAHEATD